MLLGDACPGEQPADLADRVDGDAAIGELLEVGAGRGRQRQVAATLGPLEGAGHARERPRDDASHRVLLRKRGADPSADLVQVAAGHDGLVGRDLEHRVLARVDDQRPGAQVLLAELIDHADAVVRAVAEDPPAPRRCGDDVDDFRREAVRVGGRRLLLHDPHQLPVTGCGVLAPPRRAQPPVEDRFARGRDAGEREHAAQSQPAEGRKAQSPGGDGEVPERVRPVVAVGGGIRQSAGAAGVEHDDERAAAGEPSCVDGGRTLLGCGGQSSPSQ
jgi:hypothetical protein